MSKDIGARPVPCSLAAIISTSTGEPMLHCSPGSLHMPPLPLLGYLELLYLINPTCLSDPNYKIMLSNKISLTP